MTVYVGIDPGLTGAVACLYEDGTATVDQMPLVGGKVSYHDLREWLAPDGDTDVRVCCEEASMQSPGKIAIAMSHLSVGVIYGMCLMAQIPIVRVKAVEWKKKVLAGRDWKGRKEAALEYVRSKYPKLSFPCETKADVDRSTGKADALCIAEYGAALDRLHERSKV